MTKHLAPLSIADLDRAAASAPRDHRGRGRFWLLLMVIAAGEAALIGWGLSGCVAWAV